MYPSLSMEQLSMSSLVLHWPSSSASHSSPSLTLLVHFLTTVDRYSLADFGQSFELTGSKQESLQNSSSAVSTQGVLFE
jgi:hypothetical protein